MRRLLLLVLSTGLVLASCGSDEQAPSSPDDGQVAAAMASSDHYVGAPQRVLIGLILADQRLISFGSVDVTFSYVGTAQESVAPERGPSTVAVYLPTPGTPEGSGTPTATLPSEGRGVYQAEDVTFDRAGFWQLDVTADVEGLGVRRARTTLSVLEEPAYPAPGDEALPTKNLVIGSDAPAAAIDSRAASGGEVPDPELHEWTIARALRQGRPALVLFATPAFCASRFCGPVTDVVKGLAVDYDDRAVFIHVEIWQDFEQQAITEAAAEWLFRDGNLTEPWTFLIGPDGRIVDRWATLFREEEVRAALEALPPMQA
ncbi:MAG TPA: hypothetical protein VLA90_10385 [Actinomycetota bacterium]|nr:hypothetical protein [Actinomycetota bacterium]